MGRPGVPSWAPGAYGARMDGAVGASMGASRVDEVVYCGTVPVSVSCSLHSVDDPSRGIYGLNEIPPNLRQYQRICPPTGTLHTRTAQNPKTFIHLGRILGQCLEQARYEQCLVVTMRLVVNEKARLLQRRRRAD